MIKAKNLLCDHLKNPIGMIGRVPAFSWEMTGDVHPVVQSGYHIWVSKTPDFQMLVWDSGYCESGKSVCVPYGGALLHPAWKYYWKVCLWDTDGKGPESEVQTFVTPLFEADREWKGAWISGETEADFGLSQGIYFEKTFSLPEEGIKEAYFFATAHGIYELSINGKQVGDGVLMPGWTEYQKRLLFQTYEVTELLRKGENVIRAHVGPGWYKGDLAGWIHLRGVYGHCTGFNGMLLLRLADGREEWLVTDGSWKWRRSPAVYSEIYHGEIWDARLEKDETESWSLAQVSEQRKEPMTPMDGVFVKKMEERRPEKMFRTPNGELLLDFGQNMVGWVLVEAEGEAGDYVELSHGEILDQAGNLYTGNLREARQRVKYILKGEEKEVFTPHFTWQGFRYVRIDHFPGEPELERFTGLVIYSDLSQAGYFSCSNELLNRLEANIRWGMKGNFVDIPTDCPQRDERLGWTGDIQVFSRTASYLMKTAPFFRKWLRDLQAAQLPDGGIPYVVPDILTFQNRDVRDEEANHSACGWGDAATVCPYMVYRYSGDIRILEENYSMMKQWVEYIHKKAEHGTIWNRGYQYGDWLALDADSGSRFGKTPNDLTATAYYSYSVLNVIKAAKELGKVEDEKRYTDLYRCIQEAFQKTFYDEHGHLKAQTQTAQVLALAFGLTGETFRENTVNDLIRLLEEWKGISTGFLGTPQICHVLKQNGRTDLAYGLLMKTDYPSWLYAVTKGATTIWEHWDSIRTDGSFWSDGMNSFNHYAYGCIGDWIYSTVLGIDTDEEYPGYQKSIIAPVPGGGLTWVKGGCHTPYGELKVAWTLEQGLFTLNVKIPENTTSRVILPGKEQVYEVGSGSHQFQCRI